MKRWWALLAPLVVAACGDEGPTEVGAGLLPPDVVRTFELILEPHQYMVFDTAFGLYSEPSDMGFLVVANQFEGALQSHGLVRFSLPSFVTVVDTLGVFQVDSVPAFVGGTMRIVVDTLRSGTPPVRLALHRTVEPWDINATWQTRSEANGVATPWNTPGGTGGALIDTATWVARTDTVRRDSLVFRVDSATIALWRDTANAARGALLVSQTPDTRVRTGLPVLEVEARSRFRPDSLLIVPATLSARTFIFTPSQPDVAPDPRIGGTPAWRTIVRLRERMDTLSFACPGVPNCRFTLGEATVNQAVLRLVPVPPPPGFRPEADLGIAVYTVLPTELVPLQRSPLMDFIGAVNVPRTRFTAPDAPVVEVPVTELMRRAATPPEQWPAGERAPTHFAMTSGIDALFGFGTFQSMPQLRLVVTIVQELQLP